MSNQLQEAAQRALNIFDWLERRSIYQDAQMKLAHVELRAALASQPAATMVDREEARRYCDPDFQKWLDEQIADGGHTVFDTMASVHDAYSGFCAAKNYAAQEVEPVAWQARKVKPSVGSWGPPITSKKIADQLAAEGMEVRALVAHPPSLAVPAEPLSEKVINRLISASEVYQLYPGALLEFVRDIEAAHGIGSSHPAQKEE